MQFGNSEATKLIEDYPTPLRLEDPDRWVNFETWAVASLILGAPPLLSEAKELTPDQLERRFVWAWGYDGINWSQVFACIHGLAWPVDAA